MDVLVHGSSPWYGSGMSIVSDQMAKGLAAAGHDVHLVGGNISGPSRDYPPDHDDPDEVYTIHGQPNPGGPGIQLFKRKLLELKPDLAITNRNWQSLDWMPQQMNDAYMNHNVDVPLLMYGPPVEAEQKPPLFERQILEDHLNDVWMVPYTGNRYEAMREEWGVGDYLLPDDFATPWVPHGVDTDVFYPGCREDHAADGAPGLREGLDLGDRYIGLFVGENWRRKNLDVLLEGWKRFRDRLLDDGAERPLLLLHTDPAGTRGDDKFYSGWNLGKTAIGTGLNYARDMTDINEKCDAVCTKGHVGQFIEAEIVAMYMDTADVYCLPTSGEGFSLTTLEAMATGTPIVQTDVPTLRWLSQDAAEYVETVQSHALNTGERMQTPSAESLARSLYDVYYNEDRREEMADEGQHRAQSFSWSRMREEMADVVDHLATEQATLRP